MFDFKKYLLIVLLLLIYIYAFATIDTSGIYFTKADFLNNNLQYKTLNHIPTPVLPVLARFVIERDAFPINIKTNEGKKKAFLPGSFFAFENNGVKYLYLKESNDYAAVVNDASPLCMIVKKKVHFSGTIAFADNIYFYTTNLDNPFKEFTIETIKSDFGMHKREAEILLQLHKKIIIIKKGYDTEIHKKAFLECRKMVNIYMNKLKELDELDNVVH